MQGSRESPLSRHFCQVPPRRVMLFFLNLPSFVSEISSGECLTNKFNSPPLSQIHLDKPFELLKFGFILKNRGGFHKSLKCWLGMRKANGMLAIRNHPVSSFALNAPLNLLL